MDLKFEYILRLEDQSSRCLTPSVTQISLADILRLGGDSGPLNEGKSVMAIAVPTEVPVAVAIFIMLPYFVATIATIIYTNRKTRKSNYNDNDNNSKDIIVDNNDD